METVFAEVSLKLIVILVMAKLSGETFVRLGQSPVLGELVAGTILGPAVFNFFIPGENEVITYLALLGLVVLLFEVGLETNINQLRRQGLWALIVAVIGVSLPLIIGYIIIIFWLKDWLLAFFVGATMTATSVGITVRVLAELRKLDTIEGRVILGAAVIDDIIGLVLLSIVTSIATGSGVSIKHILSIIGLAVLFLSIAIFVGIKFVPKFVKYIRQMKMQGSLEVFAFLLCIGVAYLASEIGLALIVGAFMAGLMLESVEEKEHILPRMRFVSDVFVPLFFVSSGAMFNPRSINSLENLALLVILSITAFAGKLLSGMLVKPLSLKGRLTVGVGMVPRGEVGLIFAATGLITGVFNEKFYSIVIGVIMVTTFITPILLKRLVSAGDYKKMSVGGDENDR